MLLTGSLNWGSLWSLVSSSPSLGIICGLSSYISFDTCQTDNIAAEYYAYNKAQLFLSCYVTVISSKECTVRWNGVGKQTGKFVKFSDVPHTHTHTYTYTHIHTYTSWPHDSVEGSEVTNKKLRTNISYIQYLLGCFQGYMFWKDSRFNWTQDCIMKV